MPIEKNLKGSDTLVIAATGINYKMSMPVPVFLAAAGLAEKSSIIITDHSRRMALGGIAPECPSFFSLLDYLRNEISRPPVRKVIVTGTSAGAHTALLLGHILKADYAVAFSPYSYLSIKEVAAHKDPALHSLNRIFRELDRLPEGPKQFFDLRDVLSSWNGKTRYYVHVSRYHGMDRYRAMYLKGSPHVEIVAHPFRLHSVPAVLADSKRLGECFVFPYRPRRRPLRNAYLRVHNSSYLILHGLLRGER